MRRRYRDAPAWRGHVYSLSSHDKRAPLDFEPMPKRDSHFDCPYSEAEIQRSQDAIERLFREAGIWSKAS